MEIVDVGPAGIEIDLSDATTLMRPLSDRLPIAPLMPYEMQGVAILP